LWIPAFVSLSFTDVEPAERRNQYRILASQGRLDQFDGFINDSRGFAFRESDFVVNGLDDVLFIHFLVFEIRYWLFGKR